MTTIDHDDLVDHVAEVTARMHPDSSLRRDLIRWVADREPMPENDAASNVAELEEILRRISVDLYEISLSLATIAHVLEASQLGVRIED